MQAKRFETVPPHDQDAEQSVLGAMLADPVAAKLAAEAVKDCDFYKPRHKQAFAVMLEALEAGRVLEDELLYRELCEFGWNAADAREFIAALSTRVAAAANVEYFCAIVKARAADRKAIEEGYKLYRAGLDGRGAEVLGIADRATGGTDTPAASLFGQLRDEISGKRFAADWPWRMMAKLTKALLPQTVTLFGGSKGATKSFMLVQAAQFWMEQGYKPAVLMLEEDRTFHLRRALAQLVENGDVTDPDWVKNNRAIVDEYEREHSEYLNKFGECIYDTLEGISTAGILNWIESVAAKGSRVIVVDPITVRDADDKHVWIDDKKLINVSKQITRKYNTSLVLAAHPPKTNANTQKQGEAWGDEAIGGGVILQNLAQNVVSLVNMRSQDFVSCKDWTGLIADVEVNRKLQLRKTRSGKGQGYEIGFWFDPKTLKFEERGVIGQ